MKELHFYLLAIFATLISGFSVGLMTAKLLTKHEDVKAEHVAYLKKPTLIELVAGIATWCYALAWFFTFIDGSYFVWVPGVLVWLTAYANANKYYLLSFKEDRFHFYIIVFSAIIVIGGYYLIKSV